MMAYWRKKHKIKAQNYDNLHKNHKLPRGKDIKVYAKI